MSTKKKLGQKWNKKMGGRSCFVTSGAFGDTLLYTERWDVAICQFHAI